MRIPCLGSNHPTIGIQTFSSRSVDVKVTLVAVYQDALFSRHGIGIATLSGRWIEAARDQSNVSRV
jgi:hypothetical protein